MSYILPNQTKKDKLNELGVKTRLLKLQAYTSTPEQLESDWLALATEYLEIGDTESYKGCMVKYQYYGSIT